MEKFTKGTFDFNKDVLEYTNFHQTPIIYDVGLPHTGIVDLCSKNMTAEVVANYKMLMKSDYKYRLYADGLPSATVVSRNPSKHT